MRIITYPPEVDPVNLMEKKLKICPFCKKTEIIQNGRKVSWRNKKGKESLFDSFNKYKWASLQLQCKNCNAVWVTDYYPADIRLFNLSKETSK